MGNYKYQVIYEEIEQQIKHGDLEVGDKVPSLRSMANTHNLSIHTVMAAYHKLEENGYLEANERSGYSVLAQSEKDIYLKNAIKSKQEITKPLDNMEVLDRFFEFSFNKNYLNFGSLVPHESYYNKSLVNAEVRKMISAPENVLFNYGEPKGIAELNRLLLNKLPKVNRDDRDAYTSSGTMNSIFMALSITCKAGDVVALESPVYFGFRYLLESLNLKVLEINGDPQVGLTCEQIKQSYKKNKFKAIILISSFSNPSGSLTPDLEKEKIVKFITKESIHLIEDDVYGELYFGKKRAAKYIDYDKQGRVFYCNSISKTISPALKLGWLIAPKKYSAQLKASRIGQIGAISPAVEMVCYKLLKSKNIMLKIRRSANSYKENIEKVQCFFRKYGEGQFKTSNPLGGFCLWVEGPKNLKSIDLYDQLIKKRIVIAPGTLFSSKKSYDNYFRINCAFEDFESVKKGLKTLIAEALRN